MIEGRVGPSKNQAVATILANVYVLFFYEFFVRDSLGYVL